MSAPKVKEPRFTLTVKYLTVNAALSLTKAFRLSHPPPVYVQQQIEKQVEVMCDKRDKWKRKHFKCAQHKTKATT